MITIMNIICADSIKWFTDQPLESINNVLTGLPDMNEMGMENIEEYLNFVRNMTELILTRLKPNGYAIFIQTDRKINGQWLDKSYYITGYGDNRCGHYVFINNEKYNTIDDDYCGHRAFSLVRFIPEKWVYNINVCENYLIYNSLNIKNALISLSSYIRYNALLNIDCLFIILNFYYFPQHLICEIKSFIINIILNKISNISYLFVFNFP